MTTQPYVELLTGDFSAAAIEQLSSRSLGTPRERINSALIGHRLMVMNYVKAEMGKSSVLNATVLRSLLEAASGLYMNRLSSMLGPVAQEVYQGVFSDMDLDVPASVIYSLSDEHVKRIGGYFNETSRDAALQGYNTYVNRQLPPRMAADKVMDAYGLTPRQMSGYLSLDTPMKVASAVARSPRAKAVDYVARSFQQRVKSFSDQEQINLYQQAQQAAWTVMSKEGVLSHAAQKVWLTAKDEKTCIICAPMNGKRVQVTERFELPNKIKVWVAGVHPNCRCEIRVLDPMRLRERMDSVSKADKWYDDEFVRSSNGRFARVKTDFKEPETDVIATEPTEVIATTPEEKVTLAPPTEKVTLAPEKVSLTQEKVNLTPEKVTLTPQTSEPEKVTLTPEKVQLAGEKVTLQDNSTRVKLDKEKIALALTGLPPILDRPMRNPRTRRRYSPTVKLPDPVYAVIPMSAINMHGQIELDHDVYFTKDESEAAQEAMDMFDHQISDYSDYVTYNHGAAIQRRHPVTGNYMEAVLDASDVMDVVWAVAVDGERGGSDASQNSTFEVEWQNDEGDLIFTETVTAAYIAKQWEIEPGELEMTVIRLQEGHDSSLGATELIDSETAYGWERWATSGTYSVSASNKHQMSDSIPITIYDLEPDVEVTDLPDILGDGWNDQGR